MDIQHAVVEDDIVVVALRGRLDLKATPPVQAALLKHLAEEPAGVIVDLAGVEAIDPSVLVADAAGRLHTEIVLRLELRRDKLGITVQHNGPVPHPRDPQEDGEQLGLVRGYALAAGTRPHPEGGSTSWCLLPVAPPPGAN